MDRLLVTEIYNLLFNMHTGLSGILPGVHAGIETCTCSLADVWRKVSKCLKNEYSEDSLAELLDKMCHRECLIVEQSLKINAIVQTIRNMHGYVDAGKEIEAKNE